MLFITFTLTIQSTSALCSVYVPVITFPVCWHEAVAQRYLLHSAIASDEAANGDFATLKVPSTYHVSARASNCRCRKQQVTLLVNDDVIHHEIAGNIVRVQRLVAVLVVAVLVCGRFRCNSVQLCAYLWTQPKFTRSTLRGNLCY